MNIKKANCIHKNLMWIKEKSIFKFLNGDRIYLICKDCNKILFNSFMKK